MFLLFTATRLFSLLIACILTSCPCFGQLALGISSGSGGPGSTLALSVNLTAAAISPAAIEWTLGYSSADFSSASITAGPAAAAANKSIACNNTVGLTTCMLWGMNATPISNGVIATVALTISNATTNPTSPLQLSNIIAADPDANSLPASSASGSVMIQPGLYGFSCNPVTITASATSTCTVSLTSAAPSGGAAISLSASPPAVNVPAVVTIPQGTSSATFAAIGAAVASSTSVTLTASYSGLSEGFGLTINPPPATHLSLSGLASNGTAGQTLPPVMVMIEDMSGSIVNSTAPVTISSTPAGLIGTTTVMAVNGLATFTNLVLSTANSYTLTASSNGLTSATSTPIAIGPAWYSSAWSSRKAVIIDHTKVAGSSTLTNFPVLFSVTDASLRTTANGGSVGKPDGSDLLFTASDGITKLNHEIQSYTAATGQLMAWVQIPALSPAADTVIYLYYGNTSASNQQNIAGAWDSSYRTVWHLSNATALSASDSTAVGNNGTILGAPVAAAGPDGGGANLSSAYITAHAAGLTASSPWTVSLWIKLNSNVDTANLFTLSDSTGQTVGLCYWNGSSLLCQRGTPTTADTTQLTNAPAVGGWHLYTFTYDGSSSAMKIYVDGTDQSAANTSGIVWSPYGADQFALSYGIGGSWQAPMSVDEVHVANLTRSPAWIATEYNNQSAPSTFYRILSN